MSEEKPKIDFKDPIRQILNEEEIINLLGDAYASKGYKVCQGVLDNWQDQGEKTATLIICGNNIACACERVKAEQAANDEAINKAMNQPRIIQADPGDSVFED
jgi:hypothetical protein